MVLPVSDLTWLSTWSSRSGSGCSFTDARMRQLCNWKNDQGKSIRAVCDPPKEKHNITYCFCKMIWHSTS